MEGKASVAYEELLMTAILVALAVFLTCFA